MEQWNVCTYWCRKVISCFVVCCLFVACEHNNDMPVTIIQDKILQQNIIEYCRQYYIPSPFNSNKNLIALSVQFKNDTIQCNISHITDLAGLLTYNSVALTQIDSISVVVQMPQLKNKPFIGLNDSGLMSKLKVSCPELYREYKLVKKEFPDQVHEKSPQRVLDGSDAWTLKFVKGILVAKKMYFVP